jgi:hypothetical protein
MTTEKRRVLTAEEKAQLRKQWPICYICEQGFEGYDDSEIQWDHIYAYALGYPQDLEYFAPMHASRQPGKLNCHKGKGTKSPIEYKEEVRIKKLLGEVTELKDLCPKAKPVTFHMDKNKMEATINGERVKLYKQTLQGSDFYYFFHELSPENIETDNEIQLRPIDSRITGLVFHLKKCPQLLPSLGRLDTTDSKIRVFDGQHKAVAQIIGNRQENLPFLVFVDPNVNLLRNTVLEAHTRFVQQRYQPSHIDRKLCDVFGARIETFQGSDPNKPYSEKDILVAEPKAKRAQYLEAWIIEALRDTTSMANLYIARTRSEQRSQKPFLYSSLKRFVESFALLESVEYPTGHPQNFRDGELNNLTFILEAIRRETLEGKWDPSNPEAEPHKLARTYYYDHAVRIWLEVLEESINYGLSMLAGKKLQRPMCYRREFSEEEKKRVCSIVKRLFSHGLWLNPVNQQVLSSSFDLNIRNLFRDQGLDSIYCTKV